MLSVDFRGEHLIKEKRDIELLEAFMPAMARPMDGGHHETWRNWGPEQPCNPV